jgi:hypothetical protein
MKTYYIYYLPNAVRDHLPGITGKIGYSSLSTDLRKNLNHYNGLDVSGHIVLVDNIPTLEEAKRLEYRYQQILRCVDGVRSPKSNEHRIKMGKSNQGKPKPETQRKKMSKAKLGKPKMKSTCIHCGLLVSPTNMSRWHGDKCKQNPNRSTE